MFSKFLDWRVENGTDNCISEIKFVEFPLLKARYNHGYHKTDKEGRPFYFEQPGKVVIDELFDLANEEKMRGYYMQEYEKLIHWRLPACSKAAGKTIDTTFSCLDMDGFSMSSLNKKTIAFVKIAIQMGQNFYPEIMYEMYIIRCPLIFRAAFQMFKPFIDEKTRKKIHIHGSSFDEMFEKIDKDNVPSIIGGNCECNHVEGGCNMSDEGPWKYHQGDEFAESQFKRIRDEEGKMTEEDKLEEEPEVVVAKAQSQANEVMMEAEEL